MIELNKHENEIKGRRKDRKNVGEYTRENPEAMLFGVANNVERQVRSLRKQRERLLEKDAPRKTFKGLRRKLPKL
jgi:predicted translin family RNA/ssDNA-binding protein